MRILIQNIHIFTTDGEESVLNFSDSLTFVYGNIGVGKSTMLNLIMYAFGCNLIYTPAVKNCLEAVQLEVRLDDKLFKFFRMANSNRIQIDDVTENIRLSLLQNQMSTFLYNQLSLPDLYLSMGNIEDRKVKLSFTNFCWFSYLKQSEMDNCFYNLDNDNIYKQNAAVNVLSSFFENEFLIDQVANQKYRELKRRLRQFEDSSSVFKYIEKVFGNNGIIEEAPNVTIKELKKQISSLIINGNIYNKNDLYNLLDMQKKIDQLENRVAFERRRDRYFKELEYIRKEIVDIDNKISFNHSLNNSNAQQLYDLFLDCLINIGFQGVSKYDNIYMDSKNYMPILSNSYENREISFSNLGSGGKKTLFKICFAIAVHRLQHAKKKFNYLPSFLIIDTPMKNISEREDAEMYDRFYQYLFTIFSTELSDTQLLVVDKEARDLTSYQFRDNVIMMHMTRDEWVNPPLFKNYKEL